MKPMTTVENLKDAYDGSYYFIAGCGGPITDWTTGIEGLLADAEIGKPVEWYLTTGAAVNLFAGPGLNPESYFPLDLTCLLFPLDGLNAGRLAMFKIEYGHRWFDDVIDNMRSAS